MQLSKDDMNAIFDGGATVASAMQAAYALGVEQTTAALSKPASEDAREGFVSVPVEPTSMHGLSITSSVEDGTWLRFDLPGGASAAISVLLLAEKFNEKSIVSQVLKEWSAMIATAKKGTEK